MTHHHHHVYVPFRSKRPLTFIVHLLLNPVTFGFYVSLLIHENAKCSWEWEEGTSHGPTIFTYFWGTYLTLHIFTWFVVFIFVYQHVISVGIYYALFNFHVGCHKEAMFALAFDVLYGFWAGGEILGGWCDLEQIKDCIQNDDVTCDSFAIRHLTRMIQGLCERLTLSQDSETGSYGKTNLCLYLFRYLGHFIMTVISTSFTLLVI